MLIRETLCVTQTSPLKFNGRVSQRHYRPLQGNGSATILAHVRCQLQNSPATGSTTSYVETSCIGLAAFHQLKLLGQAETEFPQIQTVPIPRHQQTFQLAQALLNELRLCEYLNSYVQRFLQAHKHYRDLLFAKYQAGQDAQVLAQRRVS
jgi:hypothetical protein